MSKKVDAAYDRLLRAAGKYVDALGGRAVVGGGVQIQEWPGEPARNFVVAVKIMGVRPPRRSAAAMLAEKGKQS